MPELTIDFAGELLANRLNFDPYLGYGYENYARAHAYWNYLVVNRTVAPFGYRDSEGKDVIFFSSFDEEGRSRVYKAYSNYLDEVHHVNEPVTLPVMAEGERVHSLRGIGTYFIVLRLVDENDVPTRTVLVKTTSSDWSDWTTTVDLPDALDGSSWYYDHKSGNYIKVWAENETEVWYCLFDGNFSYLISPTQLLDTSTDFVYVDPLNELEYHEDSKITDQTLSVAYDRVNGEMLIRFHTKTMVMDTKAGGLSLTQHEITLNFSMAESTLADGVGLVLNNLPYQTDANYQIHLTMQGQNGVCHNGHDFSSLSFDEYYEGGVISTEHYWENNSAIEMRKVVSGVSVRGCVEAIDPDVDERMFSFVSSEAGVPSYLSIAYSKALTAVGNKLVATGEMGGAHPLPTAIDIHAIDGDTIIAGGNEQLFESSTDLGELFISGKSVTTVMKGMSAEVYGFTAVPGNIHLIYNDSGEVKESETAVMWPGIPQAFIFYGSWTFDGNLSDPTFYFLVTKRSWEGSTKENVPIIIKYHAGDPNVGWGTGWTAYTSELDLEGREESKASLDSLIPSPTGILLDIRSGGQSMFTDQGHVVFVTEWEMDDQYTRPTISVFDPETDTVVHSFRTEYAEDGPQGLGYHPAFGYYATEAVYNTHLEIVAQDTHSYADFWSGAERETFKLPIMRSSDATLRIGKMPVFVGGRFSDMQGDELVHLNLSATNYVYIERSLETPFGLRFSVTDELLPNNYYRILIAKVVCDAHRPISQTTYKANWKA